MNQTIMQAEINRLSILIRMGLLSGIVLLITACNHSIEGYYTAVRNYKGAPVWLSMQLNDDSTALFVTDYNNYTPELVQEGTWKVNKQQEIEVWFRSNLLKFVRHRNELVLADNKSFGKAGLQLTKDEKPVDTGKHLIVWVAPELPQLPPCREAGHAKCLRVRWGHADKGNYFVLHDSIKNFHFQPGNNYKLKVIRKRLPDLPPDSLRYEYLLEEELLQRKLDRNTYF